MAESFNPYAPPASEIIAAPAAGSGACSDGKLVRLELEGRLPDRCIRCNDAAEGYRLERTLYWRPSWWNWTIWGGVFALFATGMVIPQVMLAFWPFVIVLWVADLFVRRKVIVEIGLCRGHRRLRQGLMAAFALSWALIVALVAAAFVGYYATEHGYFWLIVLAMFVLGIAVSLLYRVRVKELIKDHMWLQGAGQPFRDSLPAATS